MEESYIIFNMTFPSALKTNDMLKELINVSGNNYNRLNNYVHQDTNKL